MMFKNGGRDASRVCAAVFKWRYYAALGRAMRIYTRPFRTIARYLLLNGRYPDTITVRTPLGKHEVHLFSPDDLLTVNEVFCRQDYYTLRAPRCVVDIGSNIGISGLYFATRNSDCQIYLYEPVPANIKRLRENLQHFEHRIHLETVAVGIGEGIAAFGVEGTGRYGGLTVDTGESIKVTVREINNVIAQVLATHEVIDVLKVDVEGMEEALVRALREEYARRIRTIFIEARPRQAIMPEVFEARQFDGICVLRSRRLSM